MQKYFPPTCGLQDKHHKKHVWLNSELVPNEILHHVRSVWLRKQNPTNILHGSWARLGQAHDHTGRRKHESESRGKGWEQPLSGPFPENCCYFQGTFVQYGTQMKGKQCFSGWPPLPHWWPLILTQPFSRETLQRFQKPQVSKAQTSLPTDPQALTEVMNT